MVYLGDKISNSRTKPVSSNRTNSIITVIKGRVVLGPLLQTNKKRLQRQTANSTRVLTFSSNSNRNKHSPISIRHNLNDNKFQICNLNEISNLNDKCQIKTFHRLNDHKFQFKTFHNLNVIKCLIHPMLNNLQQPLGKVKKYKVSINLHNLRLFLKVQRTIITCRAT